MWSIMKNKHDNNVTDRIGMIFIKYDTELSKLIEYYTIHDEDEIGQWCERSYISALHPKRNWTIMTDLIDMVYDQDQTR